MKNKPLVNNSELEYQNAYISTLLSNLRIEENNKRLEKEWDERQTHDYEEMKYNIGQ